ncbi:methylated-DNA--[protein]-cysteine S-methyltransferase [Methylosinus sp. Sm6]|nr:methylated-DNA--[protein]-cysteine S-methyltransferase [Methylosinus sp. Sm6]
MASDHRETAADRRAPAAVLEASLARAGGAGLELVFGFHRSPFGEALLLAEGRGLAGLGFVDGDREAALDDFRRRWPKARLAADAAATAAFARRVFDPAEWRADRPLLLAPVGSRFDLDVWRRLLDVAPGATTTYGEIARSLGRPSAARAVGGAVGRNPIAFVVPCHRVIGAGGALTGYHWGLPRKQAMLAFERSDSNGKERAFRLALEAHQIR